MSTSPTFIDRNGAKVFHCESNPASLDTRSTMSSPNPSPLLRLPAELRLQILAILFEEIHPDDWLSSHHHDGATPASVIFACKQLFIEGRDLALNACTFQYEDLPSFKRMIGGQCMITCDYCPAR